LPGGLNDNTLFRNHALLQFITDAQSPATVLQTTDIGGLFRKLMAVLKLPIVVGLSILFLRLLQIQAPSGASEPALSVMRQVE
jgi:hypothetical protein